MRVSVVKQRRGAHFVRIAGLVCMDGAIPPKEIQVSRLHFDARRFQYTPFHGGAQQLLCQRVIEQYLICGIEQISRPDAACVRKHEQVAGPAFHWNFNRNQCSNHVGIVMEDERILQSRTAGKATQHVIECLVGCSFARASLVKILDELAELRRMVACPIFCAIGRVSVAQLFLSASSRRRGCGEVGSA